MASTSRCYIVAEIGVNHNGSLDEAIALAEVAATAGADALKVQCRTPELCMPPSERNDLRATPWGQMGKLAYRKRVELDDTALATLDRLCDAMGLLFFGSAWDLPALERLADISTRVVKIPSARNGDSHLIARAVELFDTVIVSTGLAERMQVSDAALQLRPHSDVLLHCVGCYPTPADKLCLDTIPYLCAEYGCASGYSGHEVGVATTVAAAAIGAVLVERHITRDRAQPGSDHAASLEPEGLRRLVRDIRAVESARGVRPSWPLPCERAHIARLTT